MCASGVGKPSVVGPGAAVGNSNADRELCGSLGLKCRVTPADLAKHGRAANAVAYGMSFKI